MARINYGESSKHPLHGAECDILREVKGENGKPDHLIARVIGCGSYDGLEVAVREEHIKR